MEHGPQVFITGRDLKHDISNLNLTNKLIRKCKTLGREQRFRYIELGKFCEECNENEMADSSDDESAANVHEPHGTHDACYHGDAALHAQDVTRGERGHGQAP